MKLSISHSGENGAHFIEQHGTVQFSEIFTTIFITLMVLELTKLILVRNVQVSIPPNNFNKTDISAI